MRKQIGVYSNYKEAEEEAIKKLEDCAIGWKVGVINHHDGSADIMREPMRENIILPLCVYTISKREMLEKNDK